jgi:hypothetical protein
LNLKLWLNVNLWLNLVRDKYIETGRKIKIVKESLQEGLKCPICFNCFKRLDKHLHVHDIHTKKEKKKLIGSKKQKRDEEGLFLRNFKSQYLEHRISGKKQRNQTNRDIKSVEKIVGFWKKSLEIEENDLQFMVTDLKAIRKLGENETGYIDIKVMLCKIKKNMVKC